VARFNRRFPQVRWRICGAALGGQVSLPLFGFWLVNACPLMEGETEEDRGWTVLLLVDSETWNTSVTTGYRAEAWLSDDMWDKALAGTKKPLFRGKRALAVCHFLQISQGLFEKAWIRSRKQLSIHKA